MPQRNHSKIEQLRAEIRKECKLRDELDQSLKELYLTAEELEENLQQASDDDWKIRWETQKKINKQLETQQNNLKKELDMCIKEKAKSTEEDSGVDISNNDILNLEKEKHQLEGYLRNLEWRLDEESKAYHKANDDRRQYELDLVAANGSEAKQSGGLHEVSLDFNSAAISRPGEKPVERKLGPTSKRRVAPASKNQNSRWQK